MTEEIIKKFEEAKEDYKALVDFFYNESKELLDLKATHTEYETVLKDLEAKHKNSVINEKDEKGKPVYTNETQRNVATKISLANNSTYATTQKKKESVEKLINEKDLNIIKTKYRISLKKREMDFYTKLFDQE